MGIRLNPEWYKAVSVKFQSSNPLLKGKTIVLDLYYVTIQERDKENKVVGEREVACVTHESLLKYYRETLMPFGMRVSYEIVSSNPMICKCVLEKPLTAKDKKVLLEACPEATPEDLDYTIHIEAIGEATTENAMTEVSRKHLANTAENRAFDRCMVKYLSIGQIYGSSEEIGENDENTKKVISSKDWLERMTSDPEPEPTEAQITEQSIKQLMPLPTNQQTVPKPEKEQKEVLKSTPDNNAVKNDPEPQQSHGLHITDKSNYVSTLIGSITQLPPFSAEVKDRILNNTYPFGNSETGINAAYFLKGILEGRIENSKVVIKQLLANPPKDGEYANIYRCIVQTLYESGHLSERDGKLIII